MKHFYFKKLKFIPVVVIIFQVLLGSIAFADPIPLECPPGQYWDFAATACLPIPDCPSPSYFLNNNIFQGCVDAPDNIPIIPPGDIDGGSVPPINTDIIPVDNANTDPPCDPDTIESLTCLLKKGSALLISAFVPLIFALAILSFIWGVVNYVLNTEDSTEREQGQKFMLWGIIALFVMISIWGILAILANTFNAPGVGQFIPQLLDH